MEFLADILLAAGAIGAGFYCLVLSRRLRSVQNMDEGVGQAVAALSSQVEQLTQTVSSAQTNAERSAQDLRGLTDRAETVSRQLELMIVSTNDLTSRNEESEAVPDIIFTRANIEREIA